VPTATGSERAVGTAGHRHPKATLSGRLNPPYEPVNLSIFAIPHLNQINDLGGTKITKTGKIHILYEAVKDPTVPLTVKKLDIFTTL
jgi:hypothetical protein